MLLLEKQKLSLRGEIRLRKEHFGGIVFDTQKGTVIDVDREAFILLSIIQQNDLFNLENPAGFFKSNSSKVKSKNTIKTIIEKFLESGILSVDNNDNVNCVNSNIQKIEWPNTPYLSVPETVHWAITYRCETGCLDCYTARHSKNNNSELSLIDSIKIVDKISEWGVFQLAIGGGEPLLRHDLEEITHHAHQKGMVIHVTTGQYELEDNLLNRLSKSITCLQIGIKHEQLAYYSEKEIARLTRLVNKIKEIGIYAGANLILCRSTINNFDRIIDSLIKSGFNRITLLRYKPPASINRWKKEKPSIDNMLKIEKLLPEFVNKFPNIDFRIDCGLSFLQRGIDPQKALISGLRGCVASNRILALAPDGSVFPCSQLIHPKFYAGNILTDEIEQIWKENKKIKIHRFFREKGTFKKSKCGVCKAKQHCGGCRVFSG